MNQTQFIKRYSVAEERINIVSHALGLLLSVFALALLILKAVTYGDVWHVLSFSIFGACLIALYTASTIYHSAKKAEFRIRMRVIDHAAIYLLIAGTYTPYTLVTLNGVIGWSVFAFSWGMAIAGVTLKIFFTGKYNVLSTLMYIAMGWAIVFAIKPLIENLPADGIFWLLAGGVAYTVGAILYSIKKIKFNHAIFHVFVLAGSSCHFISIYYYVLPAP